jgi:caffeoyl-CoA O-methyltransferase
MPDAITLPRELTDYIRSVSLKESDIQRRLREETLARPDASMMTSPEQAQFLALLVRLLDARRCLEIGVFTGYTSLFLAQALPEGGTLVACDVSEDFTSIARPYWREAGVEEKIDLRLAPATDTLDGLLRDGHGGTFDLAYIDADKTGYLGYYERVVTLLRPGGILAADNVLYAGRVVDPAFNGDDATAALRAFTGRVRDDARVWSTLLPIRDGLTLAVKKKAPDSGV